MPSLLAHVHHNPDFVWHLLVVRFDRMHAVHDRLLHARVSAQMVSQQQRLHDKWIRRSNRGR